MPSIPEETLERVKMLLRGRVRELQILWRDGCVVLQGKASSYHVKQLAQHFLLKSLSVVALVNEIEVQNSVTPWEADNSASGGGG